MKTSILLLNLIFGLIYIVGKSPVVCQEADTLANDVVEDLNTVELTLDLDDETTPESDQKIEEDPVQSGPLIDLLGTKMQSLQIDPEAQTAQVMEHYTNEALSGKKVIGLYFSADWYVFNLCLCHLPFLT